MEHLINWITGVIAAFGYPGVLVLMAIESACIPIPSEAIMPFAGSLIVTDPARHFNFHVLAFVGAFGNLLGSCLAYWVGAAGGRPFLNKYGKYLLIRRDDLDSADHYFQKYGEATVFTGRLLPLIRAFISLPAGIARMNFGKFCIYTFAGALPFCYLITYAGVQLGYHWQKVHLWLHKADLGVCIVLLILFVLWLKRHLRPEVERVEPEVVAGKL